MHRMRTVKQEIIIFGRPLANAAIHKQIYVVDVLKINWHWVG